MANPVKVYSVQPRFRQPSATNTWLMINDILTLGDDMPPYGDIGRNSYLMNHWMDEPILAGAFTTWTERAQTANWKIIGGKNNSIYYAQMLNNANNGKGWSDLVANSAIQYLVLDPGSLRELGRGELSPELIAQYDKLNRMVQGHVDLTDFPRDLEILHKELVSGKVRGIQSLDVTRCVYYGIPHFHWRYFPYDYDPISFPNENILQIMSMSNPMDWYPGMGFSPLSRLYLMKQLMLGYLIYFRQEIGDLPPEMVAIINGLSEEHVRDSLEKYKKDREEKGHSIYGKIWWLGSDDPMSPVNLTTNSFITSTKSFNYQAIVETWVKAIALNTGEDVGEFWLIQHAGATKDVQSIQALKSRGKGVARYLQEDERHINNSVLPFSEKFEYDYKDDVQDAQQADIVGKKIGNLKELAALGVDREDPAYTMEEIKNLAVRWEIVPDTIARQEIPFVITSALKHLGIGYKSDQGVWIVERYGDMYPVKMQLKNKDERDARFLYDVMKEMHENFQLGGITSGDQNVVNGSYKELKEGIT